MKIFVEHPKAVGESYGSHLWFALKNATIMIYNGIILIIHGIFPFVFAQNASRAVLKLYNNFTTNTVRADTMESHKKADIDTESTE